MRADSADSAATSSIAEASLLHPTSVSDVLALWSDPVYDSHPVRHCVHERMREQVRTLTATMQPGDELRWYDQDGWTGLAVVRSGAIAAHAALYETISGHCYIELVVHFSGPRPTAREVMAVRKLDPSLRDTSLQSVVALVGDSQTWNLGRFYEYNIDEAERRCLELGLKTERT